jgi:hypothetical protein
MATPTDPNVSLLPQPSVPTPIMAMRGGGQENVSLLPQPDVPTVIQPMRGGGVLVPVFKLVQFNRTQNNYSVPRMEKPILNAYGEVRRKMWGEKFPNNFKESLEAKHNLFLPSNSPLMIFFVYSFKHFTFILKSIEKLDQNQTIIFIAKTTEKFEAAYIYKYLISQAKQKPNRYFLFEKNQDLNKIAWTNELNARGVGSNFLYLEPTSVTIQYTVGEKKLNIILSSSSFWTPELNEQSIALVGREEGTQLLEMAAKGIKKIIIPTLKTGQIYSIDTSKNPEFWNSEFLELKIEEVDLPALPTAAAGPKEPTATTATATAVTTAAAEQQVEKAKDTTTKVPEPVVVEYIITRKDTIPIQIGSETFEIRKAKEKVLKSWEESKFSESETAFLSTIGLTPKFFKENVTDRKTAFLKKIPAFMKSLVISRCFKDMNLLLRRECELAREFSQELYELKQIDRLSKLSVALKGMREFDVKLLQETALRQKEGAFDILLLLSQFKPIQSTQKYLFFVDLQLPKLTPSTPASSAAAASASASIVSPSQPPQRRSFYTFFARDPIFKFFGRLG